MDAIRKKLGEMALCVVPALGLFFLLAGMEQGGNFLLSGSILIGSMMLTLAIRDQTRAMKEPRKSKEPTDDSGS